MTTPPTGPIGGPLTNGTSNSGTPTGATPGVDTNQLHRPPSTGEMFLRRNTANDQTTILTPVAARTDALDRIPLSERKRWRLIATVSFVVGVVATVGALTLWVLNVQWQGRADDLTAAAYDMGQNLSDVRSQVVEQQADIDLLTEQLVTSQARVIELADASAQAGDAAAHAQQEIAYYQELAALGGSVALTLNRCVNEHEKLVGYLENPDDYDAGEVAQFKASVNTMCNAAQSANTTLQQELTK